MAHYHKGKRINNHRRVEILFKPGDFDIWEDAAKKHGIKMCALVRAALDRLDPRDIAKTLEPRRAA